MSQDEDEENISTKDDSDVRFDESVSVSLEYEQEKYNEYEQFANQLGAQFDDETKEQVTKDLGIAVGQNKVVYDALGEIIKQLEIIREQFK